MKKILVGAMVAAVAFGGGVAVSKEYSKGQDNATIQKTVDNEKKDNESTGEVVDDKTNGGTTSGDVVIKVETQNGKDKNNTNVDNKSSSTGSVNIENKGSTTKGEATNGTSSNSSSNTGVIKNPGNVAESNSIYKSGVTDNDKKIVKEKYESEIGQLGIDYGSHFRRYGELVFAGEGNDGARIKEFYNSSDKMLNDLWSGLKTILSDSEMKKLTNEQNQWIKEKESIKGTANEILSAQEDTLYEQAKATYKRAIYLANKYLPQ